MIDKFTLPVTSHFAGADVTHPPPGSPGPSVAAVVCSIDLPCTQYTAECCVQDAREETITDLAQMVEVGCSSCQFSTETEEPASIQTVIYRAPRAWGPKVKQVLFFRLVLPPRLALC